MINYFQFNKALSFVFFVYFVVNFFQFYFLPRKARNTQKEPSFRLFIYFVVNYFQFNKAPSFVFFVYFVVNLFNLIKRLYPISYSHSFLASEYFFTACYLNASVHFVDK